MRSEVSWSEVDYFIRCVLSVLLGVLYYGFFKLNVYISEATGSDVCKLGKWCEVKYREVDYFIRYVWLFH